MLVSGSTVSELPISSSKDMLNKYNDEKPMNGGKSVNNDVMGFDITDNLFENI